MNQHFRPRERLQGAGAFARVFARRCRADDEWMTVHVAENDLEYPRLGISVHRRIGNAAVRNYAKRRIREAFRQNKMRLAAGLDHVCVVRRDLRGGDVVASLLTLGARATGKLARRPRPDPNRNGSS